MPCDELRRAATQAGWPVLEFERPVALRPRLGLDTPVGKAAVALLVLGSVAALAVTLARRRSPR